MGTLGDTAFDWRPEGWWEPGYHLRDEDRDAYRAFLILSERAIAWRWIDEFVEPADHRPSRDGLKEARVEWWARFNDALWIIVDRWWSGFPDPMRYSLHELPDGAPAFLPWGQFETLPTAWTFPPQGD